MITIKFKNLITNDFYKKDGKNDYFIFADELTDETTVQSDKMLNWLNSNGSEYYSMVVIND